jgi:hypothetical protein
MLPHDIRKLILLSYVTEPTRTAFIDKRCRLISFEVYPLLLKQYGANSFLSHQVTALPPVLSSLAALVPSILVKKIYEAVRAPAKELGFPIAAYQITPIYPLSTRHLEQLNKLAPTLTTEQLNKLAPTLTRDKAVFCRAAFAMLNQDLSAMADDEVIAYSKQRFVDYANVFEMCPGELDLDGQGLTYIHPHIALMKGIAGIRLAGNPLLTPETVRDACKALPKLIRVAIGADQTALAEMFQQDFPHLDVTRVHNLEEM